MKKLNKSKIRYRLEVSYSLSVYSFGHLDDEVYDLLGWRYASGGGTLLPHNGEPGRRDLSFIFTTAKQRRDAINKLKRLKRILKYETSEHEI